MSGQGKYTVYAPPASDKNTLLNKLFHSADAIEKPLTQDLVGKEIDARAAVLTVAKDKLQPTHQDGDPGMFPAGVNLDFSDAPDVSSVKWTNPGDPAAAYIPDITSPGPGKAEGIDKDVDPNVKLTDVKPNTDTAHVGTVANHGTTSPIATNAKIIAANLLGVSGKLGDSGANK
jgi:hypothetical protein